MGTTQPLQRIPFTLMSATRIILTLIVAVLATASMAEESFVVPNEFQLDAIPTDFVRLHPKTASMFQDGFGGENLLESTPIEEYYASAKRRMDGLLQGGKRPDECVKAAETSISSVLQEFKTTQMMLDKLDDGAKCSKKGQMEIQRASARWQKATKILQKTTVKRKETDKDSCKKEATAKEYQKISLKEYVRAKQVAIETQRECKCAVIRNVAQLVSFSKKLVSVREKTVVRETVLICIVKARAKGKSTKACKSTSFIASLRKATKAKLTLKKKVLAKGVAGTLCGKKEKDHKENLVKEKPRKEKKRKENKTKEKKGKETKAKEGKTKESKRKEKKKKVEDERTGKERKSKELKTKEIGHKERGMKDESKSKEASRKESAVKERKDKEVRSKERRGKESRAKEVRAKEAKIKETKEKETSAKIEKA